MIVVDEEKLTGAPWFQVRAGQRPAIVIACGRNLEQVLIQAEKALRTDLDDLQGRLHAERQRLKAEQTGVNP